MSSMHFVVHPLPGTEDQLIDRLKEVSDRLNRYGHNGITAPIGSLRGVKQVVVGPSHVACLLEDGQVCRVAFSIIPDRLDLSKNDSNKGGGGGGGGGGGKSGASGSGGGGGGGGGTSATTSSSRQQTRARARIMRTNSIRTTANSQGTSSRAAGVIIGGTTSSRVLSVHHTTGAQYVPEDLITQAQVVLQGKSRSVIIRELQRTNLDVNLAVNNLLSRDDEEAEEGDAGEGGEGYVPEDLISLLDGGYHSSPPDHSVIIDADAMFSEDMFGYSGIRRSASSRGPSLGTGSGSSQRDTGSATGTQDRTGNETFSRWRDRQYFGPRKWLESALKDTWDKEVENKKKEVASPLWISDEMEYWEGVKFTHIAALHSELVGLSTAGHVHQWKWHDSQPYKHPDNPGIHHPRAHWFGMGYAGAERVSHLSGAGVRCSIGNDTTGAKIATWLDETVAHSASRLEHSAKDMTSELGGGKLQSLHVCALYTVAKMDTGSIYWWGVLPLAQRAKIWEKHRARSRKHRSSGGATAQEVTTGSTVAMKSSPMYQPGAIGFTISQGIPKVGILQYAAWNMSDSGRFKLLPPPVQERQDSVKDKREQQSTSSSSTSNPSSCKSSGSGSNNTNSSSNSNSGGPAANKETADRLDMPPPPSPASSTCSDTSTSHKRARRVTVKGDDGNSSEGGKRDEEEWPLKEVVFVEDVKNVLGRVLKVDGAYAIVRFPTAKDKEIAAAASSSGSKDAASGSVLPEDMSALLQECRLLRRDELQVMKYSASTKSSDCFQKTPRKLSVPSDVAVLSIAVDARGVHAIVKKSGGVLGYAILPLNGGRPIVDGTFPSDSAAFQGSASAITLSCAAESIESVVLLKDGNSTLYPLAKDCLGCIREPPPLDLPPLRCASVHAVPLPIAAASAAGITSKSIQQVVLIVLVSDHQTLMPYVLRCDLDGVRHVLHQLENDMKHQLLSVLMEKCDGNRNVLHACVSMCQPTSNKEPDMNNSEATTAGVGGVSGIQEESIPTLSWATETFDATSGDEDSLMGLNNSNSKSGTSGAVAVCDPAERRNNALVALKTLCESSALSTHLSLLLTAKDGMGQTPFMLAVSCRAYHAALALLDAISRYPTTEQRMAAIFPRNSPPDHSPLLVLCCNDTCSFTWTGQEHISQEIFECRTCGLTGTLCCCTECAKVCHKGHDCKIKRTAPTAYCDCWEKCRCKALVGGNWAARCELLARLSRDTHLATHFNSRGESILLFLVQTFGRQAIEHRQFRASWRTPARSRGGGGSSSLQKASSAPPNQAGASSSNTAGASHHLQAGQHEDREDGDTPDHDLEPPRFARKALMHLLADWPAVEAALMCGSNESESSTPGTESPIHNQSGTTLLDKFTHSLIVKCSNEMLDTLLSTLIKEQQNDSVPGRCERAKVVARRFVRSVARIFVIFSIELVPGAAKKRGPISVSQSLERCRRVFSSLCRLAAEELCETADSLIAPVRLGVVRPTAPFTLSSNFVDVINGTEDLFLVEPLQSRRYVDASILGVSSAPELEEGGSLEAGGEEEGSEGEGDAPNSNSNADNLGGGIPGPAVAAHNIQPGPSAQSPAPQLNNPNNTLQSVPVQDLPVPQDENNDRSLHEELVQEIVGDAESESELDLLAEAETESDSDDQDNTESAQRSIQTGATQGSDTGIASLLIFNEEESGDSTQPEDEDSEAGETDWDERNPDMSPADGGVGAGSGGIETGLERRGAPSGVPRSNLAPQSMQWAIRNHREATRSGGVRLAGGSSLVFIDPTSLRRTANATHEPNSTASTASCLARAFGIVLRQIAEILSMNSRPQLGAPRPLQMTHDEVAALQSHLETRLRPTWEWVVTVMDATEAQLRFGAALSSEAEGSSQSVNTLHSGPRTSNVRPRREGVTAFSGSNTGTSTGRIVGFTSSEQSRTRDREQVETYNSRREFLAYCLSLMRAHNAEHLDSLPVLDVSSLKHVAYVLDALIYYMRCGSESNSSVTINLQNDSTYGASWNDTDENENDDTEEELVLTNSRGVVSMETDDSMPMGNANVSTNNSSGGSNVGRKHAFFQRSDSTLCLGCPPPDPFISTIHEALPLAEQPHLLQPSARREELFGIPRQPITVPPSGSVPGSSNPLEIIPTRLGLSMRTKDNSRPGPSTMDGRPAAETQTTEDDILHNHLPNCVDHEDAFRPIERAPLTDVDMPEILTAHVIREEPQDLSCSKEGTCTSLGSAKMDMDTDGEYISDSDSNDTRQNIPRKKQHRQPNHADSSSSGHNNSAYPYQILSTSTSSNGVVSGPELTPQSPTETGGRRPQIIVTPRKMVTMDSMTTNHAISPSNSANSFNFTIHSDLVLPGTSNSVIENQRSSSMSRSPSKSVIVRAGDLVSLGEGADSQEISAHVTVETSAGPPLQDSRGNTSHRDSHQTPRPQPSLGQWVSHDLMLGRWRLSLDLFGRVFTEDVGLEPGSVVSELGGFPVKEAKFRRDMEKLRNAQQRDLSLNKLERDRCKLLQQTFSELNSAYSGYNRRAHGLQPPLAVNRVKVTFKDEPGEGSGVARSFYTSIAEAILADEKIPILDWNTGSSSATNATNAGSSASNSASASSNSNNGSSSGLGSSNVGGSSNSNNSSSNNSVGYSGGASTSTSGGSSSRARGKEVGRRVPNRPLSRTPARSERRTLSVDAPPYSPGPQRDNVGDANSSNAGPSNSHQHNDHLTFHQAQIGERLYPKVHSIHPTLAGKITGMLLELGSAQLLTLLSSDVDFRQRVREAMDLIVTTNSDAILDLDVFTLSERGNTITSRKDESGNLLPNTPPDDSAPLFYCPGKRGYYSPRQGHATPERINAFRNIGRVVGLCLLQNELCPVFLNRHVLKYLLGRRIRFHDMAFFDPVVYESLRQLVLDAEKPDAHLYFRELDLNFSLEVCNEEGGGCVELIDGGRYVLVTSTNLYNYVRNYANYRMVKSQEKALEAMRHGVLDVLPESSLEGLTAEDLRLLLNGVGDINVSVLISYTSFTDESGQPSDKLARFKRWLWALIDKMTHLERQDLVYFWTGSPALPASEEGFQPMPSVTIRPADDAHLPTANTCISRLYLPLYSSRAVLKHKLLLAIKAKNFGFV